MRARHCEHFPDRSRIQYAACWACQLGQCPGGWHEWADADDVEHALANGHSSPSGQRCGCVCADGPGREQDPPDLDAVSIDATPCPVCGSEVACGYDAEGRPLIHALGEEEE